MASGTSPANESRRERPSRETADRANASSLRVRHILFPTDLSPESDHAFEHARFLGEFFQARLTLYHAVEGPRAGYADWIEVGEELLYERAAARAREGLAQRTRDLTVPHEIVVKGGVPALPALVDVVLLDWIRRTRPDLTVMATHSRSGAARFFLGSVTEQVLRESKRPVLCIREPEGDAAGIPYRRILVTTDLSPTSRRAFPWAAGLARALEAEVIAVHVAPSPTLASLAGIPPPFTESVPSEASVWRFLQPDFADLPVTTHLFLGSAWDRIVFAAREERADLIVMSSQGHDSLGDHLLGSHTERVVRHAPCPVLVV